MTSFLNFIANNDSALTAISTAVIAVATMVSVGVTIVLARENRILRKAGTDPKVVAYLLPDHAHKNVLNLVLANIGQGPAIDVSFKFPADGTDFRNHSVEIGNNENRSAISVLPQSEKVTTFFGMGPDLFKEPRLKPFTVYIRYKDTAGRQHTNEYLLDISQFDGLISIGTPADHEIAKALTKIEEHLRGLSGGSRRIKVETISTNQLRKEQDEYMEKRRLEAKAKSSSSDTNTRPDGK